LIDAKWKATWLLALAMLASANASAEGPMDLSQAQRQLNGLGYQIGTVDGKAGAKTRTAIRDFQRDRGLPQTGTLDPATWTALNPPAARPEPAEASPEKTLPRAVIAPPPDAKVEPAAPPPASGSGWMWMVAALAGVWWWRRRQRRTIAPQRAETTGQEPGAPSPAEPEYRQEVAMPAVACAAPVRPDVCGRTSSCGNLGSKHCPLSLGVGKRDCIAYTPLDSSLRVGGATATRAEVTTVQRPSSPPPTGTETPSAAVLPLGSLSALKSATTGLLQTAPRARDGWHGKGEAVTVRGFTIADGLVYVGARQPPYRFTNFLINPSLSVASSGADTGGLLMSYYPSYDTIDPRSRLAYLQWLAGGKRDPSASIGYVFLYFYGLEHRIFGDQAIADAPVILAEVERLRGIYATNHSFDRYSREFREVLTLMAKGVPDQPPPFDTIAKHYERPMWLKLGIGRILAEDRPIPAEWMLAWFLCDPEAFHRTAVTRARAEFHPLFLTRFRQRHPDGLKVAKPKSKLRCTYRLAANNNEAEVAGTINEWPDITRLQAPLTKAQEIAGDCMIALDAYSRYLGKNPEGKNSLHAYALLPPEAATSGHPAAEALLGWLEDKTGTGAAQVEVAELCRRLEIELAKDKIGRPQMRDMSALLARFGHGVEPDPQFGGPPLAIGQPAILFRLPAGGAAGALSPAYTAATHMLSLAALVIHADGQIVPEEERMLIRHAEDSLHLSAAERARLEAHALWLLRRPPGLAQIKARLAAADTTGREALARFALALANADGHVSPQEIRLLERIYKLLDIDPKRLFSDLHALAAGSDEPVTVQEAGTAPAGHPIPPPPATAGDTAGVRLDMARIRRIHSETTQVSALLSEIFVEEQPEPEPPTQAEEDENADNGRFPGLDPTHAALLGDLLERPQWPRGDFETLARSYGLLPDGALETLNEWAFDHLDDAVAEDGDPITIHTSLIADGPTP